MRTTIFKSVLAMFMVLLTTLVKADYNAHKLTDYRDMVMRWNQAHNDWKFKELETLYADKVMFYWSPITKQACISDKENQVSPSKIFTQKIVSEISVLKFGDPFIKCEFIKEVNMEGKTLQYPSYLILKEIDGELKIVCEGDLVTDANLNLKLEPSVLTQTTLTSGAKEETGGGMSRSTVYSISSVMIILIIAMAVRRRKRKAAGSGDDQAPLS